MEHHLQTACVKWFDLTYPKLKNLLFSIPNEGARSPRNGARLKAMGRRAGMPDLCLLPSIDSKISYTVFFEFKTKKGKLSKAQEEMHEKLKTSAFCSVFVINDAKDFMQIVKSFYFDV